VSWHANDHDGSAFQEEFDRPGTRRRRVAGDSVDNDQVAVQVWWD
jgi:hypothetical protein